MGGYGSGGHNKTHRQLENFHRIDSFAFCDYLKGDKYLFCKETVKYPLIRGDIVYYVGEGMAEIREGDSYTDLILSGVPGIDGKSIRLYFHCPNCGKRVRYLYRRQEHYLCRNCAKLNYASQQKSGMDEMRLKMERIVEKKLGYTHWWKDYPDTPIEPRRLLPSCFNGGSSNPLDERKEGDAMCVTYSDLIQIGIFIVALIGLCYTIFRGKRK